MSATATKLKVDGGGGGSRSTKSKTGPAHTEGKKLGTLPWHESDIIDQRVRQGATHIPPDALLKMDQDKADCLKHFRADSNVRDYEHCRLAVARARRACIINWLPPKWKM
ncbi:hypothetical protein C8R45DRAFT_1218775, partial [Mycena sanguinolenta]